MQRLNDHQKTLIAGMIKKALNGAWLCFVLLALLEIQNSATLFFYIARSLIFWILAGIIFVLVSILEFKFEFPEVELSLSNLSLSSSKENKDQKAKSPKKKKQDRTAF